MRKYMLKVVRQLAVGTSVGLSLLLSMSGTGCKKDATGAGAPAGARPPSLVNVETSVSKVVPTYLDEIGKATAREMVTIMPQISGRVDEKHFVDGADLKKGELLFTIDARPFQAILDQALGQLAKDEAVQSNNDRFLARQADVFKKGFVSPSDYDTAQFNAKAAQAAVMADKATIEAAKLNVEYCTIRSPIDGRAGARLVDPGNVVKINETPLLVIQRLDPIYADFTINERELADVRAHMADHTLKTLVKIPTDTGPGREGDLTFLDNAVQDASGTIKLRATIPNADRHIWPGQFVNVRLVLSMSPSVLVPASAPSLGQQGPYLYVIKGDAAEIRPIAFGQAQGDWVVIKNGVAAGEQVVTNGQMLLYPGAKVIVQQTTPAPAAPQPRASGEVESPPGTTNAQIPVSPPTTQPTSRPAAIPATSEPAVLYDGDTLGGLESAALALSGRKGGQL
jgi:multidrug efflux system membrane fusion protein